MRKTTSGFTIVELLIVIVVIAILATISIVAYNGIQNRTYDSIVQSDLSSLAKKVEVYRAVDDTGGYPSPTTSALTAADLSISKDAYDTVGYNLYYCTNATSPGPRDSFAFAAKSKSGNTFYVSSNGNGMLARNLSMNLNRACDRIDLGGDGPSGNVTYGYDSAGGSWRAWAN